MIELVFVIVVLGILASIAIPRFAATRDDAQVAKGRSDIAAIRSAIVNERQTRLLKGDSSYIDVLDNAMQNAADEELFVGTATGKLLQYPISSSGSNGHWMKTGNTQYQFNVLGNSVTFDYNSTGGTFTCDRDEDLCKKLID